MFYMFQVTSFIFSFNKYLWLFTKRQAESEAGDMMTKKILYEKDIIVISKVTPIFQYKFGHQQLMDSK